ncbi:lysozyme [Flavobacterium microcysteis]|nr:lysozyme [Flavobacterium microcysteis]
MKISSNGILQLTSHESLRLEAYDDKQPNKKITSASQVKGVLTIGYGHTKTAKVGMKITKEQAQNLLAQDLRYFENRLAKLVKVDVNQNMVDSLISFMYNIGDGAFAESTVLKVLNQKKYDAVPAAMLMWNKPAGIVGRRTDESKLFLLDFGVLNSVNVTAKNIANDAITLAAAGLAFLILK